MGTRHCIIAIKDKQTKIGQYGQFDGYPSGHGKDVLQFLKDSDLDVFSQRLDGVSFITEDEAVQLEQQYKSEDKFLEVYPQFHRETSDGVLGLVYEGKVTKLTDSSEFAQDSLFCEWCYVIDLDKRTFEVYKGFNQSPLTAKDRFYIEGETYEKYYPVKLAKKYKLDKLPEHDKFLKDLKSK